MIDDKSRRTVLARLAGVLQWCSGAEVQRCRGAEEIERTVGRSELSLVDVARLFLAFAAIILVASAYSSVRHITEYIIEPSAERTREIEREEYPKESLC